MTFTLWPAIDLKAGKCVRLLHGDMEKATVYGDDPAAQAKAFEESGFSHLHVVDLDGAFAGKPENADAVEDIIRTTKAKVEIGGGIRSLETVERWLSLGVSRVIIGTAAVKDPEFTELALNLFSGRIVLGIDAKDGRVATEGWDEVSDIAASDLIKRYDHTSIAAVVYTDISRDGALTGANVEATRALARETSIPVIASGGIAKAEDISDLLACRDDGVAGAILGRSLYERTIEPKNVLSLEGVT
ncbi:1-(5-phosphoribosyl)-5-[(5-phosphoribosylamino)methylideneamino]imidazole-4-carboxamide isomerase [Parvularcula marina]|uniref:1-(5-phosphoribosyl)-5-[(5-phosphoribosylamino)methylideneamino] imidazole-4-carboxamide isomerase n=1 Tax=Parvularcula marina TaxID=2292771 RepID=A0A371RIB4_9PROT|nr:1-(5-phosphoribosyl)-5-[(5-phosphoribosylamino)methylideneamino]imidazole-4-carboxamide isomerase [Parvularcula marina]RFB05182.1 1-(5-phosphoribosyl)-5-[(5-phosphoribosylamino)methylideneamino]imidazole-4-carboxamide isomerase [Parvularcula marina]